MFHRNSEYMFSCQLNFRLLEEANGIPIIFAIVFPSHIVMLEEITNGLNTLDWNNDLIIPLHEPYDVNAKLMEYNNAKRKPKNLNRIQNYQSSTKISIDTIQTNINCNNYNESETENIILTRDTKKEKNHENEENREISDDIIGILNEMPQDE